MSRRLHPFTRRGLIQAGAALAGGVLAARPVFGQTGAGGMAEAGEMTRHGLSSFGDLLYPADFKHFAYVNPQAPKGGSLSLQIKQAVGNQAFDTFNTLNVYVLKGDGAAGVPDTFDTLMASSQDEPDALYGLLAHSVHISADKRTYSFVLRREARFHDGTPVTAHDVAFSMTVLKEKGHPTFRSLLTELEEVKAEGDYMVVVRLSVRRNRDLHLLIAGLPVFSRTYWEKRDFEAATLEAPLGSGPYRVGRFEPGRFIELQRVADYWGRDLPVNVGHNNFDRIRYDYFRDREVAFEGFKAGTYNFNEDYTARIWATGYDFPAFRQGRVKRETVESGAAIPTQGWHFNLRRETFADPRIREALGLAFDFEWTNANIMFSSYKRLTSYFQNSDNMARGLPSPEEIALLEPFRDKLPADVFGEPFTPPVSDGSGSDRNLLRRADQLLRDAGCKREGNVLRLPNGKPFEIEFLDFTPSLQPHTQPFQANLKRLGINARSRIVDASQYSRRLNDFDFDIVSGALGGSLTPGDSLRVVYGTDAARTSGSRNLSGIANPAVDHLIDIIGNAENRDDLTVASKALDRVLRAGRYWIPMWYRSERWLAYWDVFSRPETRPKHSTGAPDTWWYDEEKAKRIGLKG
ncbi:MAG: ABC transporter substrate-binding protein [Chelatococcus sp.]|uniref:extracellular solute-binding protein n=1 Tax=Chelatococcus sp. TaxID=1953771 RepID=UPI0025C1A27D|nr:extracellular solute-binding protein [Chelatococcus sp.]MBX3536872.1 ABC transporter substrate-binding protein [Chelatococcus sp.]